MHFLHVKRGGLYFVATTKVCACNVLLKPAASALQFPYHAGFALQYNVSPAYTLELLDRTTKVLFGSCCMQVLSLMRCIAGISGLLRRVERGEHPQEFHPDL